MENTNENTIKNSKFLETIMQLHKSINNSPKENDNSFMKKGDISFLRGRAQSVNTNYNQIYNP